MKLLLAFVLLFVVSFSAAAQSMQPQWVANPGTKGFYDELERLDPGYIRVPVEYAKIPGYWIYEPHTYNDGMGNWVTVQWRVKWIPDTWKPIRWELVCKGRVHPRGHK